MKRFLFFLMGFLPGIACSANPTTNIENLVKCLCQDEYFAAAEWAQKWATSDPSAAGAARACESLCFLAAGAIDSAYEAFTEATALLVEQKFYPSITKSYCHLMYSGLNEGTITPCLHSNGKVDFYLCKRSDKIKGVGGALLFTVGLFIIPFNPPVGAGIMTSAGGLILDSALGHLDEFDEMKEREIAKRHIEESLQVEK